MKISTDIKLPRDYQAMFPDRCVVCQGDHPAAQVRIVTGTQSWWTLKLWPGGKPFVVRVPACKACGWKLRGLRLTGFLLTYGVWAVVFLFVWPRFAGQVSPEYRNWAFCGAVLGCAIPQTLWIFLYVLPFDLEVYPDRAEYKFSSMGYAMAFVLCNQPAPWMEWNEEPVDAEWKEKWRRRLAERIAGKPDEEETEPG